MVFRRYLEGIHLPVFILMLFFLERFFAHILLRLEGGVGQVKFGDFQYRSNLIAENLSKKMSYHTCANSERLKNGGRNRWAM